MEHDQKPLIWLHGEIKTPPFSASARLEAGFLLRQLQQGVTLGLPHSRPMPSIAANCHELRIRDVQQNWRIMYFIDEDTIVILEIFAKKTQTTPKQIINLCQTRLKRYFKDKED